MLAEEATRFRDEYRARLRLDREGQLHRRFPEGPVESPPADVADR
jgi:hypothetical protein